MITYITTQGGSVDVNIQSNISNDCVDIIFITPEQLCKESVRSFLSKNIRKELALFVIDEVHCVSEWGHDFRPNFLEIKDFVNSALINNSRIHILATTATANDLVINDLYSQFKTKIDIIRGDLIRESLRIRVIRQLDMYQRYAWILSYLKTANGSGIVYCLTIKDCRMLTAYLMINDISACDYHSELSNEERVIIENNFNQNVIKVVVATSALGMGYDKPDVSFVIHLQMPKSMLEYYQQIGRAGRSIDYSEAIILCGDEDDRIANFFINHSFPSEYIMRDVLYYIDGFDRVKVNHILNSINVKKNELEGVLKHLVSRKLIVKNSDGSYSRTLVQDNIDDFIEDKKKIIELRKNELNIMHKYISSTECYMKFIAQQLNDPGPKCCGKCNNCRGIEESLFVDETLLNNAKLFINTPYKINSSLNEILPRKQVPNGNSTLSNIPEHLRNRVGYFLSKYNQGYGKIVADDKYKKGCFSGILIDAMCEMTNYLVKNGKLLRANAIVYVPSLNRPNLVRDFAFALSERLRIPCFDALVKTSNTPQQKTMQNSFQQYNNVNSSFAINQFAVPQIRGKDIFLVDDMVDSRWTLTVCGLILYRQACVSSVTPLALADTSNSNGE